MYEITLLTKQQVCNALGISQWTLRRWRRRGVFPLPVRLQQVRPVRWRLRDVEAFIDKRQRQRLKAAPRGTLLAAKAGKDEI